jgi:predicted SAM-dependent methyltransferase
MGETSKARIRRDREGWFSIYVQPPGIDIGGGADELDSWDFETYDLNFGNHKDATLLDDVPDEKFQTVYASHILEHLDDPVLALKNWYRVLKPGGYMIVCVPHRDLYEKKSVPPSRWNPEHKTFWLPSDEELPHVRSLLGSVKQAIPEANVVTLRVIDEGYDHSLPPDVHPVGEYSIEIIVKK